MHTRSPSNGRPIDPRVEAELKQIGSMSIANLRIRYRELIRSEPPRAFGPDLLRRSIAQRVQDKAYGGFSGEAKKLLGQLVRSVASGKTGPLEMPQRIKPGSELVRVWNEQTHRVTVLAKGFAYQGEVFTSLSGDRQSDHRHAVEMARSSLGCGRQAKKQARRSRQKGLEREPAVAASNMKPVRCAIYTRKSTEHGLELEFNSLDAQREACEAYIKSQASQGWPCSTSAL